MILADLHVHSRYSRATSPSLDPEHLWIAAQLKGIDLIGTGDFTHPIWLSELKDKLVFIEDGAYELRSDLVKDLSKYVFVSCRRTIRFLLSGEISCIYKRDGLTRKVHNLIIMPNFSAVERLNKRLERIGNIISDGRPILGIDSRDLLELCLEIEAQTIFIPAHIWTPWFSLFGSNSGFNSIQECFGNLSNHIYALETGLSSNPPMNWRLSELDRFTLVSNSDAHSLKKIGRESNLLRCEPNYPALLGALIERNGTRFAGTLEFFPEEGKYYWDGHRKCGISLSPVQRQATNNFCPICGKEFTIGVLSRIEQLADRPLGVNPAGVRLYESLVPLEEILGEIMHKGVTTKVVTALVEKLVAYLGPEIYILRQASLIDIERIGGEFLAEGIRRVRSGEIIVECGFDGKFGTIHLFNQTELLKIKGQGSLWSLKFNQQEELLSNYNQFNTLPAKNRNIVPVDSSDTVLFNIPLGVDIPQQKKINSEQIQAINYQGTILVVRAGPGTGKTYLLIQRALQLLKEGIDPARILMVTFTRKAVEEIRNRLIANFSTITAIFIDTFHSLGRKVLTEALGIPPVVIDESFRLTIISDLAKKNRLNVAELVRNLSYYKQQLTLATIDIKTNAAFNAYQEILAKEGVLDLDDLVFEAVSYLRKKDKLAERWNTKFNHILVDEYQDVNPMQVELLRFLYRLGINITVIGDPDQAIYSFRGANRSLFMNFFNYFQGAVEIKLVLNYRNSPRILALAQAMIDKEIDSSRIVLQPNLADNFLLPIFCELPTVEAEANWVANKIISLLGGVDSRQIEARSTTGRSIYGASDIAILYRIHSQAPILQKILEQNGIPVQVAAQEYLAETDPLDFKAQRVSLLSMHAAKGLEFLVVFIVGLEDTLLPYRHYQNLAIDLDEERRLLYVALTRSRERLYLSRACKRLIYGQTIHSKLTPLLTNLDNSLMIQDKTKKKYNRRIHQLKFF